MFNGYNLFVKQPTSKQWINLRDNIDRCFILGDKPQETIYVGYYGNSTTNRTAGLKLDCSKFSQDNWDKAIEWCIGDYGFKNIPIFVTNILFTDKQTIQLSPLECYYKKEDTYTFLAPSNKPKKFFVNYSKDIEEFLPSNNVVSWIRRDKKLQNIKCRKSSFNIYKDDTLLEDKVIYTYSTKKRNILLKDIEYAKRFSLLEVDLLEEIKKSRRKKKRRNRKIKIFYKM